MIYQPKHFIIQEMVSPAIYNRFGEKAWWFMCPRLMETLDALRDDLGPMTVNDWHLGGDRMFSGLRLHGDYYSSTSQHSFGRAADSILKFVSAGEARAHIRMNAERFPHIGAVEEDVNWLHVDTRQNDGILWFKP